MVCSFCKSESHNIRTCDSEQISICHESLLNKHSTTNNDLIFLLWLVKSIAYGEDGIPTLLRAYGSRVFGIPINIPIAKTVIQITRHIYDMPGYGPGIIDSALTALENDIGTRYAWGDTRNTKNRIPPLLLVDLEAYEQFVLERNNGKRNKFVNIQVSKNETDIPEMITCPICYDDHRDSSVITSINCDCKYHYCMDCIVGLYEHSDRSKTDTHNAKCPMCRQDILDIKATNYDACDMLTDKLNKQRDIMVIVNF